MGTMNGVISRRRQRDNSNPARKQPPFGRRGIKGHFQISWNQSSTTLANMGMEGHCLNIRLMHRLFETATSNKRLGEHGILHGPSYRLNLPPQGGYFTGTGKILTF